MELYKIEISEVVANALIGIITVILVWFTNNVLWIGIAFGLNLINIMIANESIKNNIRTSKLKRREDARAAMIEEIRKP